MAERFVIQLLFSFYKFSKRERVHTGISTSTFTRCLTIDQLRMPLGFNIGNLCLAIQRKIKA